MPRHSPQQWRALHAEITAMIANPETSTERRRRAEHVLTIIRATPEAMAALAPPPPVSPLTDLDWYEDF